jgi:hypothetical protein
MTLNLVINVAKKFVLWLKDRDKLGQHKTDYQTKEIIWNNKKYAG